MFLKRLRKITSHHDYDHAPASLWSFLVDPNARRAFEQEPCYEVETKKHFTGQVGETWTELHNGEDCAGDIVDWKVLDSEENTYFSIMGRQQGFKLNMVYTLVKTENGCRLYEDTILTPGFSKRIGSTLLMWLLFITGILIKLTNDEEKALHWYRSLETASDEHSPSA